MLSPAIAPRKTGTVIMTEETITEIHGYGPGPSHVVKILMNHFYILDHYRSFIGINQVHMDHIYKHFLATARSV
jgi:hypothetical protein